MNNNLQSSLERPLPQRWSVEENNNEIDLRELFLILWHQKTLILLFTGLFAIAGITYAMLTKQVWSAQAVIQVPEKQDVLPLLRIANQARLVGITDFPDNKTLYNKFILDFNSYDNQRKYLIGNDDFLKKTSSEQLDDKALNHRIHDWANRISAQPVDKAGNKQGIVLSVSADTASDALNMLEGYINFITKKQQEHLKDNLITEKSLIMDAKVITLNRTRDDAERALRNEIKQATLALSVAKAARVERPLENYSSGDRFPITLGSKGLEENLNVLKSLDLNTYQPQLVELQVQIDRLKQVNIDTINFRPFTYLSSPEEPLRRDSPKRPLIVLLATLLGGMLGVGIVLVRHAFRNASSRTT